MATKRVSMILALGVVAGCAATLEANPPDDPQSDGGDAGPGLDATPANVDADAAASDQDATPTPDAATPCQGKTDCARYVFVSSDAVKGMFATVAEADQRCIDDAAKSPKLAGRLFLAWISSNAESISPATRFVHGTKPYMRMDGVVVANDWNELASSTHQAPLNHDVFDDPWNGRVWTGTKSDGTPHMNQCLSWKPDQAIQVAASGETSRTDAKWTESDTDPCISALHRLYCVEQ